MSGPKPSAALWQALRPDDDGLVAAVVQHAKTGQVLMLGYMNRESLERTFATGRVTFWSRSRRAIWEKGETSGNTLDLVGLRVDCDGDAVLITATPQGPTCHTGTTSCFFRDATSDGLAPDDGPPAAAATVLSTLFAVIEDRKAGRGATNPEGRSYVRRLLDGGAPKIGAKIREEAQELCAAIDAESRDRVASEAADLLFHMLVGIAHRDGHLDDVAKVLAGRFGLSGIDEKAGRGG